MKPVAEYPHCHFSGKLAQLNLPEELRYLEPISENFFWSWHKEGIEIFRSIDPITWESVEHNPRRLLKQVDEFLLWQKACEIDYVERVKRFYDKQQAYLFSLPASYQGITTENPVAYFCAEYGIHSSLPLYSGGLGILAGDHLKSASDMGVPLVAIGLLYRFGYFRQKITHDGWQEERYVDILGLDLPIMPVIDENGNRIFIAVRIRQREVYAQAWVVHVGRVKLYLLDTNVPQNTEIDKYITGHLYGGDSETRIVQEKLLGIGGIRLLRAIGIHPSVFHLNEGHSAFLTLELAREFLQSYPDKTFNDALSFVRQRCVFTTHTPVAAGNDVFSPELIDACFDKNFITSLKLGREEFLALGRTNPQNSQEWFGMTPLALRMCGVCNGVSQKHSEVSRKLWQSVFDKADVNGVPIIHITNGVHPPTWISPPFQSLYERYIGTDWQKLLEDPKKWEEAIEAIPDEQIWKTHLLLKHILIRYIRRKVFSRETGRVETIHEHSDVKEFFNPDVLTVGFARRVAGYKRWTLILSDFERLIRIINDPLKPVQLIFAGKAHPQDREAKIMLQNLMSQNQNEIWLRRAVFIEDYDQEIARHLVQGVDVWLNVPRRPMEASGTSGQKAAMNAVLNLSILDGWWIEGFNGENGFAIGRLEDPEGLSEKEIDEQDANSLYETLEKQVVPLFYAKNQNGIPIEWAKKMKNAIKTLTPQFSSYRMLKDYVRKAYTAL